MRQRNASYPEFRKRIPDPLVAGTFTISALVAEAGQGYGTWETAQVEA
ncbi:hypothetical protein [Brachybacterium vulturis]